MGRFVTVGMGSVNVAAMPGSAAMAPAPVANRNVDVRKCLVNFPIMNSAPPRAFSAAFAVAFSSRHYIGLNGSSHVRLGANVKAPTSSNKDGQKAEIRHLAGGGCDREDVHADFNDMIA